MSQVLEMWRTTTRWPLGERVFSFAFARRVPYFASIRPRFTEIGPNRGGPGHPRPAPGAQPPRHHPRIAETDPQAWSGDDPDVPVRVRGLRRDGTVVVEGTIRLWVTPRPPR